MRGVRKLALHLATALAAVAVVPLAILAGLFFYLFVAFRTVALLITSSANRKPSDPSSEAIEPQPASQIRRSA